MYTYTVTVIKTGNSYALRVPKAYVEQAKLELGQKIQVGGPIVSPQEHDPAAIKRAIRNLVRVHAYADIKDPVAWQRAIRQDRHLPRNGSE